MNVQADCAHCGKQYHIADTYCPVCLATEGAQIIRPRIVCLCGSTRFSEAFQAANLRETLAGKIVLSIGCDMRSDNDIFSHLTAGQQECMKLALDWLHLRKIELADEVLILNVDGYIGSSTRRELEYAKHIGKEIRYLEPLKEQP